jgi:hypothetical protein
MSLYARSIVEADPVSNEASGTSIYVVIGSFQMSSEKPFEPTRGFSPLFEEMIDAIDLILIEGLCNEAFRSVLRQGLRRAASP